MMFSNPENLCFLAEKTAIKVTKSLMTKRDIRLVENRYRQDGGENGINK